MRHVVSFRTLWFWIGSWIILDLIFMSVGVHFPEWAKYMPSGENISRHLGTAYFILGVWLFARESV